MIVVYELSDEPIRAGGYGPAASELFLSKIKTKLAEGQALSNGPVLRLLQTNGEFAAAGCRAFTLMAA